MNGRAKALRWANADTRPLAETARPVIAEHVSGTPGSGGIYRSFQLATESDIGTQYRVVPLIQSRPAGGLDVGLILRFARLIRRHGVDLVHVRGLGNEGFHAALAARLAGCQRIVVSVHGTQRDLVGPPSWRRRVVVEVLEPATLRMASHVVTVCDYARRRPPVSAHSDKLVGTIPNGIPDRLPCPSERARVRAQLGIDRDAVVVVYVGRLTVDKGVAVLQAAARDATREALPRIHFLIVGDGPLLPSLQRQAHDRGVPITCVGAQDQVWPYLDAADVFVLPSWHENLSFSLLEAMSSGLPCVATAVGGNVEVLGHGGGLLVAPGDPDSLLKAITRLASDEVHRAELGREAAAVASHHYSLEKMVEGWSSLYRMILSGES